MQSRTFAEKILKREFYTERYGKTLPLLGILTYGNGTPPVDTQALITQAMGGLSSMVDFSKDQNFNVIRAITPEPIFAKDLAEAVLIELEDLNRYFKIQTVSEKTSFINSRIASVKEDLETSEQRLKQFNEQNRQISSPSLQLTLDRLTRNVEVQKSIYLTLKQQLELSKIEEIQETSIVQVLDKPQIPLGPYNINLKRSVMLAGAVGLVLGIFLAFVRSYLDNSNIDERKKLRRVKHFLKKKIKDILLDRRVFGIVSLLLLIGLPFYLGEESKNPYYFGMFLISSGLFIYLTRKKYR